MKRLLRRTFVATSLLLSIVSLTLWGASYFWVLQADYTRAYDQRGAPCGYVGWLYQGFFGFSWDRAGKETPGPVRITPAMMKLRRASKQPIESRPPGWSSFAARIAPSRPRLQDLWFRHISVVTGNYRRDLFDVPFWIVTLISSILPLWTLRTYLRARREKKKGLCPQCGYDLRATPDRCPECGSVPSGKPE